MLPSQNSIASLVLVDNSHALHCPTTTKISIPNSTSISWRSASGAALGSDVHVCASKWQAGFAVISAPAPSPARIAANAPERCTGGPPQLVNQSRRSVFGPSHPIESSQVLRAMLRQDPDVVMVGEIRDSDTAHLALEAAMTGHLMLTSIHANDAASVVQRFENLGCSRSEVAQSLALVLVQRLARRLCPQCTKTGPAPAILIETLEARRLYDRNNPTPLPRGAGCAACDNTGLAGRIAVVESLVIDEELRAMLMAERPLSEITTAAAKRGSLIRFYQYARHLMQHGLVGPAEALLAVTT